ncbi:MAG: hypothetical protein KDG55_09310 [Rhodocyclaceae bacterium]|nr:hypothetical protein [Rhodocyclaceae bacterium]
MKLPTLLTSLLLSSAMALAGEADVVGATVRCDAQRHCRFDVTVHHADAGWTHYADRWEILAPDGTLLGSRTLLHPHDTEQPFTRSLEDVLVPAAIRTVRIRAHDSVHGDGGAEFELAIP